SLLLLVSSRLLPDIHSFPTRRSSDLRNCCKMYRGILPEDDLEHDAACLGLSKESMIEKYLIKIEDEEGKYETKNIPCDFMNPDRSEEHTSELQSRFDLVCRLLLEKKN